MTDTLTVWTIGHSNRPLEAFVELLQLHGIEAIADVRRFPGSRRLPQFGSEALRVHWVSGYRLCLVRGAWRSPTAACGFAQPGLAQQLLSRLRRSFAERRIQPRAQPFAGNGGPATHRDDVRRGALVALPPLTGIGCAENPRYRGAAHQDEAARRPPFHCPGTWSTAS